jgi:hypothetical protein
MDENIQELADSIYREKVRRARAMTPEERVAEGFRLGEKRLREMRSEIRATLPNAEETNVELALRKRLVKESDEEERGLFFKVPFN